MAERAAGRPSVTISRRVTMVDVDAVQANFAAYFRWMDAGFHELLALLDRPLASLLEAGYGTPAVDAQCSYLQIVALDDIVQIQTQIGEIGRSSFTVDHELTVDGRAVARGVVRHVWIEVSPHPHGVPVPDWLRTAAQAGSDPIEPSARRLPAQ